MIQHPLAIVAVLMAAIWFSLQMVHRYSWAARLSTILWVIFVSALLSNIGLIPTEAAVYGSLIDFCVPFAVCVILFSVDLSDVRKAGKPMLIAFGVACVGTVVGVIVASLALAPLLDNVLPGEVWKLAGPYTGTYIGGSLNFFALWEGLEIGNPDLLAAANAVDNLTLFPLYLAWMAIPSALVGRYVVSKRWGDPELLHDPPEEAETPLRPRDVVTLVFLAVSVMALSEWIKIELVDQIAPGVPTILIVTTLALVLGQLKAVRRLKGAWEIGDLAFWMFFAAVGALINFYQAVVLSPMLFVYVVIIMAIHFLVTYGVGGYLLKLDLGALTIASVASKAGPALVMPVAETKGWRPLILPGIVLGMLGYAIGNYIGFAAAKFVQVLLGS